MVFIYKIILIITAFVTFGCNSNCYTDFNRAETLMQDDPKNALALLDSIKHTHIKGNAANARFALLYSMALDKNYIDITNDSLISIAEEWYSQKGNVRYKFLSYYYKGVINKNAQQYPEAITAFSQAQKFEQELDDEYLLGQLYNQMGYIYKRHYDHTKSLHAFLKAYDLYDSAEKINHRNYMLLNIAGCYWNLGDYTNSEYFYIKAISEGSKNNYKTLVQKSVMELIGQYVEQAKYNDAILLQEKYELPESSQNATYLGNIARIYFSNNNLNEGEKALQKAWTVSNTTEDSMALYVHEYYINKQLKKTNAAILALENSHKLQNKAVSIKLKQPVLEIQKQLLEKDVEHGKYKLKTSKEIIALIGLLIFVLTCIALYILKLWINKKDKKLATYTDLLSELQYNLKNLQESLSAKETQLNCAYSNTRDIIHTRLNLINNLSTTLYEKRNTPKAKEIFIREVENIIETFRTNEDDIKWMEEIINNSYDNLLKNLYTSHPFLTKEDKKLLCYIYAGFSSKSISVFLNIPIETVYNRKYRLMAKTGLSKHKN